MVNKFLKLNENVLLEWIYDDTNLISENYHIITNLQDKTRSFFSTTNSNTKENSIFSIDPVMNRNVVFNPQKYNFLQDQIFSSTLVPYDKVRIHFPLSYNLDPNYVGFALKLMVYDYDNKIQYYLSNYFYNNNTSSLSTMNLEQPFLFDNKNWGKYVELSVPSAEFLSNQRITTTYSDLPLDNTINKNLTIIGVSKISPIFINFSFVNSANVIFGETYYGLGDTFKTSISIKPEYEDLAVDIIESTQGDFFEIYGTYKGTNENMDNFINTLVSEGQVIQLQYQVTQYEENIQVGAPIIYTVNSNFTQKIYHRPIIQFSNTTAAFDVQMSIINLVDSSSVIRLASLGLTKNLLKYGKKLLTINLADNNILKPKIYNSKPEKLVMNNAAETTQINVGAVPYPVLVDRQKILVNSNISTVDGFQGMGLLKILITPFDTVLRFDIMEMLSETSKKPYDLTNVLKNSTLQLVFKYNDVILQKDIFQQSIDNNYTLGIVVFKISVADLPTIRNIYQRGYKQFYLIVKSSTGDQTVLYNGTYELQENVTFANASQVQKEVSTTQEALTTTGSSLGTLDVTSANNQLTNPNNLTNIGTDMICAPENQTNIIIYLKNKNASGNIRATLARNNIKILFEYQNIFYIEKINKIIIPTLQKSINVDQIFQVN